MAGDGDEAPLVGRTATMATLCSAPLDIDAGATAAVFVTGESGSGSGKSRLLREAAEALNAAGATVVSGVCLDIGDASPLHPVLRALRSLDSTTSAGREPSNPERHCDSPTDGAGALLDRVCRDLSAAAAGRPLVLVLDDLHWADRSTRQLLLYLLAGLGDTGLSVLAAVRSESLQGAHPLRRVLAELRRLRSVRVIDLGPLDREQTQRLLAAVVRRDVEPEAAEQVWKRSGGNPFVVEELARALRDGRAGPSDTLREIFLSRVDALPSHAHAVAAGVEPIEHTVLAQVLALPEEQLIEAIRAAVTHRFIVSASDGYRLRH